MRLERKQRGDAFTLVELLVVVAMIVLLIALLLPALQSGLDKAYQVQCMSNIRQVTHAWILYAGDHNGYLVDPWDQKSAYPYSWDDTADYGNSVAGVKNGTLYPYIPNPNVYRCPADTLNHYRSYSMNDYLNGHAYGSGYVHRLPEISRPGATFCLIEENDERGYNMASWIQTVSGDTWIDHVPCWHGRGSNISFCDGHAEYWVWQDPRTCGIPYVVYAMPPPSNPDLARLRTVLKTW